MRTMVSKVEARLCAVNEASESWPMKFELWAPEEVGPQIEALTVVECAHLAKETNRRLRGDAHDIVRRWARGEQPVHTHTHTHTPHHLHYSMHLPATNGNDGLRHWGVIRYDGRTHACRDLFSGIGTIRTVSVVSLSLY